ncbi:hypothetical protein [Ascidiaceihabitans sp.]|uniref:hypothetical protein n=1 Tax=Ascidiaceihabitans sp. TaxID=1872644 RepID=UPI003297F5A9
MRFKTWPRHAFTDTSRKRAALRRKQRLEREALPLFADQIAEVQPNEDQVMQDRAIAWLKHEVRDRHEQAAKLRDARRQIDAMPTVERRAVRRAWDCAPYPADPSYLLSVLHSYAIGRINLKQPPYPLSRTDAAGTRVENLFASSSLFVTILKAREIAEDPDPYPLAERHAAYHHLQAAASKNKDRAEAAKDRVRASHLFLRFGELEDDHAT